MLSSRRGNDVLVRPHILHQDLVQRLHHEQHLIPARMQLLDEDALRQVLRAPAHLREVEDLLLALALVLDVL